MTKDIQNNNVTLQINCKDLSGRKLRIADCDVFIIRVFTTSPDIYISYSGRDFLATEWADEITIPRRDMEQLSSGVVQYTYHYLPKTISADIPKYEDKDLYMSLHHLHNPHKPHHPHRPDDFFEEQLINSKPVVTSIYWRNLKPVHKPHCENGINLDEVARLHHLIDVETFNRIKDVNNLNERFDVEFAGKLDVETDERKAEDERLENLIKELQGTTEEIKDNASNSNEEVENKLQDTAKNVEDLSLKIKEVELEAKKNDEILEGKIVIEKERAQAQEQNILDRVSSVTERFNDFKTIQSESLASEVERAKSVESSLNEKINTVNSALSNEIQRSADRDIQHTDLVNVEANRAKAVENKIATDLETEKNRAKDTEKHILDEVHGVQEVVSNLATATNVYTKSEVDTKINSVKNDLSTLQNQVDNHETTSAELSTKVSGLVADMDKTKSDLLAEIAKCDSENTKQATDLKTLSDSVYTKTEVDNKVSDINSSIASEIAKCDAENDKLSTELKTLSDNVYNKSEVDSKVNDLNNSISSLENWKANHVDNTEGLNEKVTKLIADTEKLSTDLSTETTARINADTTLTTKVEVAEGKVDAEAERAKDSEDLIKIEVAELKENATAKHTELSDSIAETNANLTLEIAERKAQDKINSDAIAIINGDVETSGSIKKSLKDSKDYTDAEIAKLSLAKDAEIADTLKVYAKKTDVDKAISDVVGAAPEAYDTLKKISDVLSQDNDAISAINEVLSGKANSEDVYTKTEIDTKVTAINNSVSTLETKVDNADATINGRIDDLVAKVSGIETTVNDNNSTLSDAITSEETARKSADKTISDKLDSEIAKVTDKVNELNAKVIQDIADSTAKDTEIDANISALNTLLTNVESKVDNEVIRSTEKDNELVGKNVELEAKLTANETAIADEITRSKQAEKSLSDKIDAIVIPDLTEVNSSISTLDNKVDNIQSTLQTAIDTEATTARAAEKANADNITKLSGDIKAVDDKVNAIDFTPVNNAVSAIDTKVDNEISRAQNAEKINSDNIATLQSSVSGLNDSIASANASITQLQADSSAKDSELENSINVEKNRAENAEKLLSDKIDIINGDKETVGSIAHAVEDAKHHIDDKLSDYYDKATFNEIIDGCATKGALSAIAEELGNTKSTVWESLSLKANSSDVYTKSEVDQAIEAIDVTDQLTDYATKAEVEEAIEAIDVTEQLKDYAKVEDCSIIVDGEGNRIPKLIIDLSDNSEEGIPVYNKNEIDSLISEKANANEVYSKEYIDGIVTTVNSSLNSKLPIDSFNEWSENVATKQDVNNAIESKIEEIDLSDYYNKTEMQSLLGERALKSSVIMIQNDIDSINSTLENKADKSEIPSINGLATEDYVNEKIGEIELPESTDLSNYYNKSEVNDLIDNIEISETDLSDYYTKEQVNSNFASKTQVSAKADAINVYSKADTYTKSEVNNLINNLIKTYTEDEFEALSEEEKNNGIIIVL